MDYQLPEPSSAQAPAQNLENVELQILYPHLNFRVRSQLKKAGSQHKDSPITSCVAHGDVVAEVEEGGPVFICAPPPKGGCEFRCSRYTAFIFSKNAYDNITTKKCYCLDSYINSV